MEQEDTLHERKLVIRVVFEADIARWVRESRYYFVTEIKDSVDGLMVTLRVRELREALQWLLSWGSQVRVIEPEALRELLRQEAERMLENFS